MHNAFLNIDGSKMSKSAGNFFTVREIGERFDLQILRFFMLSAQYRSPLNFSDELMEAAGNGLNRIITAADNLKFLRKSAGGGQMTAQETANLDTVKKSVEDFEKAMDDDFNTADAIAALFELVRFANSTADEESTAPYLDALLADIRKLADVLGIIVDRREEMLDSDIDSKIEERQQARKAKDFARADAIRAELLQQGIVLEDTREGVKWHRA